jgi:hypothetical protein
MHVFRVLRPALGKLGDSLPVYSPIPTQSWVDTADFRERPARPQSAQEAGAGHGRTITPSRRAAPWRAASSSWWTGQ